MTTPLERMTGPVGAERRQFGRRKICKPAVVISQDGTRMPCTIVDISESGVGLRCADLEAISETFHLLMETDDIVVLCKLVHRTNGVAGAMFLRAPRQASRLGTPRMQRARQVATNALGHTPPARNEPGT